MIPYSMMKRLITMAVIGVEEDDNMTFVYIKGYEKREWLLDILNSVDLRLWILIMKYRFFE